MPIDLAALASKPQFDITPMVGGGRGVFTGWGFSLSSNLPQIGEKMTKVVADDQRKRSEAWSQINQLMGEAKRALGEKYKAPF